MLHFNASLLKQYKCLKLKQRIMNKVTIKTTRTSKMTDGDGAHVLRISAWFVVWEIDKSIFLMD